MGEPDDWLGDSFPIWPSGQLVNRSTCLCHTQVTGDGPQGIGLSGVGFSAIGHRLQDPGA